MDSMRCIYASSTAVELVIKIDKVISPKIVAASGELKNPVVNEYYGLMILKYTDEPNGFGGIDEVDCEARVMRLTRLRSLS